MSRSVCGICGDTQCECAEYSNLDKRDYIRAREEALTGLARENGRLKAERDRLKAQLAIAVEALESIRKHEFCAGNQANEALARIKELGDD